MLRKVMSFAILGLGTALPPCEFRQADAVRVAQVLCQDPRQKPLVRVLYRQSEIEKRYLVLGDQVVQDFIHGTRHSQSIFLPSGTADDRGPTTHQRMQIYVAEAFPLALRAARQALTESGLAANDLTHIITVSCTGFSAPGVDVALIKALGLPPTVERTHIGFMGCHGALNGLRVARAFTAAEPEARVLLCAVELCSLHFQPGWDPQRMVPTALFADGAAAVVGTGGAERNGCWRVIANGAGLFPDCEDAMTWNLGDHGFDMTLSTKVPNLIEANLRPWLESWLARQGFGIKEIGSWAIHPGGPRILNAVAETLGLNAAATEVSREVLTQHGNMSSPTVLFILDRLRRQGAPLPCVALGFGPGLAAEAVLFV
jgi:predicted naringenin-chalcone synthase